MRSRAVLLALGVLLLDRTLGPGMGRLVAATLQLGQLADRGVDVRSVIRGVRGHERIRLFRVRGGSGAYPSRVLTDLGSALAPDGWTLRTVAETASTNADVAAEAEKGAHEGLVVVAGHQHAGRGRLDRTWTAPIGSGLTFSVLLRPDVPPARLGWLPLLTGLAIAEALGEVAGVPARVKWPNDVLVGDRKLAGVLTEVRPAGGSRAPGVVVGVGLNVALAEADLPVPTATSLAIEGASTTDRSAVLTAVLAVLHARYRSWALCGGDAEASGIRAAYVARCATIGRTVRVELPGRELTGQAVGVDPDGRLRVSDATTGDVHAVSAGDVVHVR